MPPDPAARLREKIEQRTAAIAVMGMGYVGLPLALALAKQGLTVTGIDVDAEKVSALQGGRTYIRDVEETVVRTAVESGRLRATTEMGALAGADAIFICVPTPFTAQKEPDVSHIAAAAQAIASHLRPGQLIVLRSTSYPGATEEIVRPALERTGMAVGRDVFLAFAPERIDPGNKAFPIDRVPVVVGGTDPASARLAAMLLQTVTPQVTIVSSPATAEMSKLLENVFRNVNIALVNQICQLCERMGLDVWEVIDAAATKPYGFMAFTPGLVGGHCIPVDPYYLAWKAREYDFHMDFVELAARVNEEMPLYVVNRLTAALLGNRDRIGSHQVRVLVLGVAFKRDVDDARYSPAVKVMGMLRRRQIEVVYHDPYIPRVVVDGQRFDSVELTPELLHSVDCVLILVDHSVLDYELVVRHARLVFDVRNATRHVSLGRDRIIRL